MYYFIYPSKDSYIYELNTNSDKNFGGDDNLVLKKSFDGTSLKGVSRVLLNFDLTELSQSLVSGEISSSAKYYLRLYEQKTSELSPTYSLATFPLSQSWEDGNGYTTQDPNSRDGVSWEMRNESFGNMSWSKFDGANDSGSRTAGGGIWITGSGECSQSFSYESPDVNMDVSDIVNNWLDSTIPNNGLILRWSGSQEDSSTESGNINFFSSDAQSIYSPKIEVRWDESTFSTGSLTQLTIDGTKDNYLHMIGLRDIYKENEKVRFRVTGRERYQTKSVSTSTSTISNLFIPENSGSYSIVDVETGTTIVPFGDYTKLSCDSKSNYFKQDLRGFINNKSYRIILRLRLNDGRYRIFDDNFNFKVVS